jgi:hypothetical protein
MKISHYLQKQQGYININQAMNKMTMTDVEGDHLRATDKEEDELRVKVY